MLSRALLAVFAANAAARDWPTIRFGATTSYAPFHSQKPDEELVGFDIDLGNDICRRMHAKCFTGEALSDPQIFGVGTAVGLRKEDADLKAQIDQAIASMLADGTYDRIAHRYFEFDAYGK